MKTNKLIIWVLLIFAISFWMIYALNWSKSPKLPWQGTPNGYYDSTQNVGSGYLADTRFSFVSGTLGSGVVLDSITWLKWESQTWSSFAWSWAFNYCNTLTGWYIAWTWRLPTVKELDSIADFSKSSPSIDTTYFFAQSNYYWSSTTYTPNPPFVMVVYFNWGYVNSNNKTSSFYVRCVR